MTPTATYIAEENCLQEMPELAEPLRYREWLACVENDKIFVCADEQGNAIIEYHNYLATLRKIPCDPSCKGLWQDQQKVVEGKDYEVRNNDYLPPSAIEEMLTAFPLVPVKSEDELWRDVFRWIPRVFLHSEMEEAIADLKKNFILTKR